MQGTCDDERKPHAEIVCLRRHQVNCRDRYRVESPTSRSLERVRANTLMPMSFVKVIPDRTWEV